MASGLHGQLAFFGVNGQGQAELPLLDSLSFFAEFLIGQRQEIVGFRPVSLQCDGSL